MTALTRMPARTMKMMLTIMIITKIRMMIMFVIMMVQVAVMMWRPL